MVKLKSFVKENVRDRDRLSCGWGWGYVIIPPGHPSYGVEMGPYSDLAHDISMSQKIDDYQLSFWPEISPEDKDSWIVGFDTLRDHCTKKTHSRESVIKRTDELRIFLENYINVPMLRADIAMTAMIWCYHNHTPEMFMYIMQDVNRDWVGYLAGKYVNFSSNLPGWYASLGNRSSKAVARRMIELYQTQNTSPVMP